MKLSCHCGAVRIQLARRPRSLTECNCSVCRRYGARWAYFRPLAVKLVSGARLLRSYERGRALHFDHCGRCGCVMRWRLQRARAAEDRMAVNMRMAEDPGQLANLEVKRFDGAVSWKDLKPHRLKQPWW